MKETNVPLVLSYRYTEVKEFKMYMGSRKGAVITDTSDISPSDLWADKINAKEELCKGIMPAFVDKLRLSILPHNYSFKYRQENGVLKIYNAQQNRWMHFAYGDDNKLVLKMGLTAVGNDQRMEQQRVLDYDETLWSAFNYAKIGAPSQFKEKSRFVAWCNVHYVFQ